MLQFRHANPGAGYYKKERGLIRHDQLGEDDDPDFPPYESLSDMAEAVFDALEQESPDYRRSGWGGLIHITNHARVARACSRDCQWATDCEFRLRES